MNLAVSLARRSDRPVVLVDADLQFGDVAVMLKLAPQHTIVDAVNAIDKLDGPLLQSLLARHDPSGLLVMPAPLEPAFADQIGSSQMLRIIELLRQTSAFVIVDAPAYFNDVVLGLIEASDDVLLVAGMDIRTSEREDRAPNASAADIPLSKLKLILNRANSKVKLDVGEVERTLASRPTSGAERRRCPAVEPRNAGRARRPRVRRAKSLGASLTSSPRRTRRQALAASVLTPGRYGSGNTSNTQRSAMSLYKRPRGTGHNGCDELSRDPIR